MGFQSIYDDRSDREDVFDGLLLSGVEDITIDNKGITDLFDDHSGSVEVYLRTGWNQIIADINSDVTNNTPNKVFLESLTEDQIPIIEVITGVLL